MLVFGMETDIGKHLFAIGRSYWIDYVLLLPRKVQRTEQDNTHPCGPFNY
jgi:hypothetical protein